MTSFSVTNASAEAISASVEDVWAAMVDPNLLAALTPLIDAIEVLGDHWRWQLVSVGALGVHVAPAFTVAMTFQEPTLIAFDHDPLEGTSERAGASGKYLIQPLVDGGTMLDIELTMCVDLPLPALSRGAVERVMRATTQAAGDRFFHNLLTYLGAQRVPGPQVIAA